MAISVSFLSSNRVFSRSRKAVAQLCEGAVQRPSGDTSPCSDTRQQLGQPQEIERGAREHEEPVDLRQAAQLHLPHPGDRLQPAEGRLDARPRVLTLRVARMPGRAAVNRTAAAPREVLRDVRRGVELAHQVDESRARRTPCRRPPCGGGPARAATGRAASTSRPRVPPSHRRASPSRRRSARGGSRSAGGRDRPGAIRRPSICDTTARPGPSSTHACRSSAVAAEVAAVAVGAAILPLETLLAGPRFDQRAVDREVLVRHQAGGALDHPPEEAPRDLLVQQPVAVLGEHRRRPRSARPCPCRRTTGTAGCNRVAPSAAARCESSRRSAATAPAAAAPAESTAGPPGIQPVELARHVAQDVVHQRPDGPQRVVGRHALLGRHITEHRLGLAVVSSHARHGSTRSTICRSLFG